MPESNPFFGATFAERKAVREGKPAVEPKQVDPESVEVEDKAMKPSETKRPTRKKS